MFLNERKFAMKELIIKNGGKSPYEIKQEIVEARKQEQEKDKL
jgi:hypothetical protein